MCSGYGGVLLVEYLQLIADKKKALENFFLNSFYYSFSDMSVNTVLHKSARVNLAIDCIRKIKMIIKQIKWFTLCRLDVT